MKVGTKSVLYGAHCFFLHPWFVAWAWWKLYGFPLDPRLWVAFMVHDLGYIGKPNMDGPEGEEHVLLGACIMQWLFGWFEKHANFSHVGVMVRGRRMWLGPWARFTLFHSRFYAKKYDFQFSRLCVADKLAICLTPAWLYLPMVNATGEIREYLAMSAANGNTKYGFMSIDAASQREWHANMCAYLRRWVDEHKTLKRDEWTSTDRHKGSDGVSR